MEERLQKLLSAAGLCSRRAAEAYIMAGRVTVNGDVAQLGWKADPEKDSILVDGNPLQEKQEHVYLLLNKPRGYVTTLSDEKGRKTVADLVRDCGTRVFPVGRLDLDSEGLLILTNDGDLMQRLLHPSGEINKVYRVTVYGEVTAAAESLKKIRDLDGEEIRPAQVEVLRRGSDTADLLITIHEGKNRQIRRMCAACGLGVKRLQRTKEHSLELGDLRPGMWRYLTKDEVSALKNA